VTSAAVETAGVGVGVAGETAGLGAFMALASASEPALDIARIG
jgi:hypothetical protein